MQSKWDNYQSDWSGEFKETQEFDQAGHRIQTNNYWREYDWELTSSTDSAYDSNGKLVLTSYDGYFNDHIFEYFYDDNNILTWYKSYMGTYDYRELWTKGFYYWKKGITGFKPEIENNIAVFPNPAGSVIKITGLIVPSEVQIIDLQGTVRLQRIVAPESEISIDALNPGIYMLNIKTPEGNITRKIIKN
jgi:hypothetical protein